jgi:hypothetical protein
MWNTLLNCESLPSHHRRGVAGHPGRRCANHSLLRYQHDDSFDVCCPRWSTAAPAGTTANAPPPPAVIEQFPTNIPRLEPDSSNRAIFAVRFARRCRLTAAGASLIAPTLARRPRTPRMFQLRKGKTWRNETTTTFSHDTYFRSDSPIPRQFAWGHMTAFLHLARVHDEFTAKSNLESTFYDRRCAEASDVGAFLRLTSLR